MKPKINKDLLLYSIAGISPAIPCFLFALLDRYAPLIIIILFQVLIHYIIALAFHKKESRISIINLIYPAIAIPIIAYISNFHSGRTIMQCGIIYIIMQVALNGCFFWILRTSKLQK